MKILFVSHGLYPCTMGGAEIFNYYLIREMSKLYQITVFTLCSEDIGPGMTVIRGSRRKFGLARISIPLQDILTIIRLRKKIDLIHITYMRDHWMKWMPYPIVKKIFNIPYIVTIHGGGMHPWRPELPHRLLFDYASDIIGISRMITEEYERRTGRKIKHIPPLIPFTKNTMGRAELRSRYGFRKSEKILLFLGSIKKIKGCDTLIDAFIGLGKAYVQKFQLRLLLAGDGNMRTELENIVNQRNFASHVTFVGNVPREDVPAVFNMSDIYILPSHFEGTPLSMLEAMFNCMPIIGSNVNGINNVIEHEKNGLLFEVNNAEDLRSKIVELVENQESGRRLAIKALSDYESNYNFKAVIDQYINIYENADGVKKR